MRKVIVLSFFALLAAGAARDARAQRRGGVAPRFARGGYGLSRARAVSSYGLGYAYLPYDFGGSYDYQPQPVVYVQQPPLLLQPAAQPVPPPATPSVGAVTKEYTWPAESSAAHAATSQPEPQEFAIVLKDGSTVSAVTVFVNDDGVHYVDPDEKHVRISMSQVDRAATLKLNRARNLNLYLPAAE